jgi:hypothetical protein
VGSIKLTSKSRYRLSSLITRLDSFWNNFNFMLLKFLISWFRSSKIIIHHLIFKCSTFLKSSRNLETILLNENMSSKNLELFKKVEHLKIKWWIIILLLRNQEIRNLRSIKLKLFQKESSLVIRELSLYLLLEVNLILPTQEILFQTII